MNVNPPKDLRAICSATNGMQAENQPVSSRYKQLGEAVVWQPLSERIERSGWQFSENPESIIQL